MSVENQVGGRKDNEEQQKVGRVDHLVEGVERSGRSTSSCRVRFVNTTQKTVDLIWLDHQGQRVTYKSLAPQTACSVHTFKVRQGSVLLNLEFHSI